MPHQDANVFRLHRDLNSPSASLRTRALRALRSPDKAYTNFDVPFAEQSIITAEERNPAKEPSLSDILKDVIVYVEVRTGNDNRSEGVKTIIAKLGAQVNDRLLRNTTHVVFKDGLLSTYKRAQSWNIPIVSILWIEACKVQRRLCEPKQFPISNIHMYEYPELYGKLTRVRYIQPDSELNRRRKRPATPTGLKDQENSKKTGTAVPGATGTPTCTSKVNQNYCQCEETHVFIIELSIQQNEITRFFKPLSQNKHLMDDEMTESPATKLLNRITNGFFTPQRSESNELTDVDLHGMGDVAREKPISQKSLSFSQDKRADRPRSSSISVEPAHVQRQQVRTPRRSSSVNTIDLSTEKVQSVPRITRRRSLISKSTPHDSCSTPPPTSEPDDEPKRNRRSSLQSKELQSPSVSESRITRRRSLSHVAPTVEPSTPKLLKKATFQSIAEESLADQPSDSKTNYVEQTMDITPSFAHIISKAKKRFTLYVSEHMEISELNDENVNPYMQSKSSSSMLVSPTQDPSKESFVTTKTSPDSCETPVPIFSSTRLPGSNASSTTSVNRRRSLFNVDMDLINDRINHINTTSKRHSLALINDVENEVPRPLAPLQAVAGDAIDPAADKQSENGEPKMRRLFTPNEEVIVTPPKSSKKGRRSSSASTSSGTSGGTLKRRRTLATPKPTAAVGPNLQKEGNAGEAQHATPHVRKRVSLKKQAILHTLVHTNMHRDQVQVIHKAIRKLRGMRLDPTVTKNTTHLVSLEPRRTLNLLRGLMRGVWIVSYKWILDSMRAGKWLNEEKYELTSFSRAIEICRTERQAFGISYQCELFRFMETFYVSSLCRPITFNNIKELLLLGGAKITENRYKAKFIVGDKRRAEDDRVYLTPAWVLDSITAMQIQKFSKYLMKSAIVTPYGIRYEDPREEPEKPHRKNLKVCYKDPALVMNK
ncbi:hypothetical protein KR093_008515 [Drosophila rubida]|uniref:BRCT domain-containing protein n=1 Tax=Drosophila rubida TaxID=30044 RepID=A0AAD4PKG5_9MUSC|nr:hypothetical protein KR093_008515 [Drosophila rubida]